MSNKQLIIVLLIALAAALGFSIITDSTDSWPFVSAMCGLTSITSFLAFLVFLGTAVCKAIEIYFATNTRHSEQDHSEQDKYD